MASTQYIIQAYKSPQRRLSVSSREGRGWRKMELWHAANTYMLTWMAAGILISPRSSSLACAGVLDSRGRPLMLSLSTWSICMAGCSVLFSSCLPDCLKACRSPNWVPRTIKDRNRISGHGRSEKDEQAGFCKVIIQAVRLVVEQQLTGFICRWRNTNGDPVLFNSRTSCYGSSVHHWLPRCPLNRLCRHTASATDSHSSNYPSIASWI